MQENQLQADYLIVGAGAMGMGFADVLLREDPSATLVIVDRRARPGGHWNNAYPFVSLHQPAAFYGVNSMPLAHGKAHLSSGAEILTYYERVMADFLASGRVTFLSMSTYYDDGLIVSNLDETQRTRVRAKRRIVDATYTRVTVPSERKPPYGVADEMTLVPLNALPDISRPWERYVVIGAGKTGMDAILFLLGSGVHPERVQWIVPNDAWLYDRARIQPGNALDGVLEQLDCLTEYEDIDDIFQALERRGIACRIDRDVQPTKWRCATVSQSELSELRRVDNVVRLGRVERIDRDEIVLAEGRVPTSNAHLHIDCTADGLAYVEPRPIFEPGRITLQPAFMCQQTFSAAIIGHLERLSLSDGQRNARCRPVPHPQYAADYITCILATISNINELNTCMPVWLRASRLYLMHHEPLHRYVRGSLRIRRSLAAAKRTHAQAVA